MTAVGGKRATLRRRRGDEFTSQIRDIVCAFVTRIQTLRAHWLAIQAEAAE